MATTQTNQTTQTNSILPGLPAPMKKSAWTMFYRHGVNALLSKNFEIDAIDDPRMELRAAVERAQKHCGVMGYKYHFVRPLICDIELEEGIQLGKIDQRTGKPFEKKEEGESK